MWLITVLVLHWSLCSSGLSEFTGTTVSKEDTGSSVEITCGEVLQIELQGTPSTGFWWHFVLLDTAYLELITEETRDISPIKIEGGPVLGIWKLRAKKVGATRLEMAYYRPWEGIHGARDRYSLTVEISPASK